MSFRGSDSGGRVSPGGEEVYHVLPFCGGMANAGCHYVRGPGDKGVNPWGDDGSVCVGYGYKDMDVRGGWGIITSTGAGGRALPLTIAGTRIAWYRPRLCPHAHFAGMFRDGEKHGSGCLRTVDGDTLEGEWIKSKPQEGDVRFFVCFPLAVVRFLQYFQHVPGTRFCFFLWCFLVAVLFNTFVPNFSTMLLLFAIAGSVVLIVNVCSYVRTLLLSPFPFSASNFCRLYFTLFAHDYPFLTLQPIFFFFTVFATSLLYSALLSMLIPDVIVLYFR